MYSNGYSFVQAKRISQGVSAEQVEQALNAIFKADGKVEQAPFEDDHKLGIDFYYNVKNKKVSVDVKVRKQNHSKLVVEVKWYNCNKQAWLYSSKADYFLFVHTDGSVSDFYLVKAEDLRKLVESEAARYERAWIEADSKTAALMQYFEYEDLKKIGKSYAYVRL